MMMMIVDALPHRKRVLLAKHRWDVVARRRVPVISLVAAFCTDCRRRINSSEMPYTVRCTSPGGWRWKPGPSSWWHPRTSIGRLVALAVDAVDSSRSACSMEVWSPKPSLCSAHSTFTNIADRVLWRRKCSCATLIYSKVEVQLRERIKENYVYKSERIIHVAHLSSNLLFNVIMTQLSSFLEHYLYYITHTYRKRHNAFPASNLTRLVQKSFWSELFRFIPNLWIHMHTIQVWNNLQKE